MCVGGLGGGLCGGGAHPLSSLHPMPTVKKSPESRGSLDSCGEGAGSGGVRCCPSTPLFPAPCLHPARRCVTVVRRFAGGVAGGCQRALVGPVRWAQGAVPWWCPAGGGGAGNKPLPSPSMEQRRLGKTFLPAHPWVEASLAPGAGTDPSGSGELARGRREDMFMESCPDSAPGAARDGSGCGARARAEGSGG